MAHEPKTTNPLLLGILQQYREDKLKLISEVTVVVYVRTLLRALSALETQILGGDLTVADLTGFKAGLTSTTQAQFNSIWNGFVDFVHAHPTVPALILPRIESAGRLAKIVATADASGGRRDPILAIAMLFERTWPPLEDVVALTLGGLCASIEATKSVPVLSEALAAAAKWAWGDSFSTVDPKLPAFPAVPRAKQAMTAAEARLLMGKIGLTEARLKKGYFFDRHSIIYPDGTFEIHSSYEVEKLRAAGGVFEDLAQSNNPDLLLVPPGENSPGYAGAVASQREETRTRPTFRFTPEEGAVPLKDVKPPEIYNPWQDKRNPFLAVKIPDSWKEIKREDVRQGTPRGTWYSDYLEDQQLPPSANLRPGDIFRIKPEYQGKLGPGGYRRDGPVPPFFHPDELFEYRYCWPATHQNFSVMRIGDSAKFTLHIDDVEKVVQVPEYRVAELLPTLKRAWRNYPPAVDPEILRAQGIRVKSDNFEAQPEFIEDRKTEIVDKTKELEERIARDKYILSLPENQPDAPITEADRLVQAQEDAVRLALGVKPVKQIDAAPRTKPGTEEIDDTTEFNPSAPYV